MHTIGSNLFHDVCWIDKLFLDLHTTYNKTSLYLVSCFMKTWSFVVKCAFHMNRYLMKNAWLDTQSHRRVRDSYLIHLQSISLEMELCELHKALTSRSYK